MHYKLLVTLLFSALSVFIYSQDDPLPRYMTSSEEGQMVEYLTNAVQTTARTPNLPHNPRAMAEWEEMQGIVISWSNSFRQIQAEIVRHAREEVTVYINTTNQSQVTSYLDLVNVDYTSNVEFINASYNSLWIRDYGPNPVYINEVDSLVIVDWIYNRPRPLDDQIPQAVGNHLNIPVIQTNNQPDDLVHTGGNFMSNGNGQGFSSNLVLDENGPNNNWGISNHSEDEVDAIMENYMGIDEYIKMINLPYDLIHHIDMHMKMIDEETIVVGKYPESVADGPQIEANLQYVLDNFQSTFGRPFNIIRMPMPPDFNGQFPDQNGDYRTYANAMFVNKTVLVPVYEEQYDTTALRIWQETLPGHDIVGINCNSIIPLSGALHCIIKEIGVVDPIWILHQPIVNPPIDVPDAWQVSAQIKHKDNIDAADLIYSLDGGLIYSTISMTKNGSNWEASIPITNQEVIYYIEATSENGKVIQKPLTGDRGGGWRFQSEIVGTNQLINEHVTVGSVYPNPAAAITAIPISVDEKQHIRISLLDVTGRVIDLLYNDKYYTHQDHIFFDAGRYTHGSYFLQIQSGNEFDIQKLIIK